MLANEPDLDEEEILFLNAYQVLHHQAGNNPISLSDIMAYCYIHTIVDVEGFTDVMVACDVEYMKAADAHQQREVAKAKAKAKRRK